MQTKRQPFEVGSRLLPRSREAIALIHRDIHTPDLHRDALLLLPPG